MRSLALSFTLFAAAVSALRVAEDGTKFNAMVIVKRAVDNAIPPTLGALIPEDNEKSVKSFTNIPNKGSNNNPVKPPTDLTNKDLKDKSSSIPADVTNKVSNKKPPVLENESARSFSPLSGAPIAKSNQDPRASQAKRGSDSIGDIAKHPNDRFLRVPDEDSDDDSNEDSDDDSEVVLAENSDEVPAENADEVPAEDSDEIPAEDSDEGLVYHMGELLAGHTHGGYFNRISDVLAEQYEEVIDVLVEEDDEPAEDAPKIKLPALDGNQNTDNLDKPAKDAPQLKLPAPDSNLNANNFDKPAKDVPRFELPTIDANQNADTLRDATVGRSNNWSEFLDDKSAPLASDLLPSLHSLARGSKSLSESYLQSVRDYHLKKYENGDYGEYLDNPVKKAIGKLYDATKQALADSTDNPGMFQEVKINLPISRHAPVDEEIYNMPFTGSEIPDMFERDPSRKSDNVFGNSTRVHAKHLPNSIFDDISVRNIPGRKAVGFVFESGFKKNVFGKAPNENILDNTETDIVLNNASTESLLEDATAEGVREDAPDEGVLDDASDDDILGDASDEDVPEDASDEGVFEDAPDEGVLEDAPDEGVLEDSSDDDILGDASDEGIPEDFFTESVLDDISIIVNGTSFKAIHNNNSMSDAPPLVTLSTTVYSLDITLGFSDVLTTTISVTRCDSERCTALSVVTGVVYSTRDDIVYVTYCPLPPPLLDNSRMAGSGPTHIAAMNEVTELAEDKYPTKNAMAVPSHDDFSRAPTIATILPSSDVEAWPQLRVARSITSQTPVLSIADTSHGVSIAPEAAAVLGMDVLAEESAPGKYMSDATRTSAPADFFSRTLEIPSAKYTPAVSLFEGGSRPLRLGLGAILMGALAYW